MRGTWQNTAFLDRKQALGRFIRTSQFVGVRSYGSTAEAERAARRVRKIHATLRGTDPDGTTFRLDEPELLLWVHCAEIDSYADIARRSGMPVSAADLDTFVAEQRRSAALVGLDPAPCPVRMADLDAYYARIRPRLHACPEAKQALLASYHPPVPRSLLPLKVVLPPFNTLAFATLPRWARRMYGVPDTPATDLAATAALRAPAAPRPAWPGGWSTSPRCGGSSRGQEGRRGAIAGRRQARRGSSGRRGVRHIRAAPVMSTAAALGRAAALARRPGPRRMLGLAGPPGAGKSTLAALLAAAAWAALAVVVPLDGFHLAERNSSGSGGSAARVHRTPSTPAGTSRCWTGSAGPSPA